MSDFKSLSRNVKSQLFSTFCLDAYGSQLWPFLITLLNCIILHGERLLGKLGACLSLLIVVFFIPLITLYLLKFLHYCLNSSNEVVKSISLSSIQQSFSTFGENYRYLRDKYKIMPYMFRSDFPIIIKQIYLYVDDHHGPHHEAVMVRELCIAIDENRFTVFTVSCALPMIIVSYMYMVYDYFLFSFDLLMFILE